MTKEEKEIQEDKFVILEKYHVPKLNGPLRYDSDKVSAHAAFKAMEEYAQSYSSQLSAELEAAKVENERLKEAYKTASETEAVYRKYNFEKDAEIERLKGLIEKAHDSGYDGYEKYSKSLSWLGFKTDNL